MSKNSDPFDSFFDWFLVIVSSLGVILIAMMMCMMGYAFFTVEVMK